MSSKPEPRTTSDYDMDAEPLPRGLLERDDLRRGVKADVEAALADVERLRAKRDRYRVIRIQVADLPQVRAALEEASKTIDRLRRERDEWEERYDQLRAACGGTMPS